MSEKTRKYEEVEVNPFQVRKFYVFDAHLLNSNVSTSLGHKVVIYLIYLPIIIFVTLALLSVITAVFSLLNMYELRWVTWTIVIGILSVLLLMFLFFHFLKPLLAIVCTTVNTILSRNHEVEELTEQEQKKLILALKLLKYIVPNISSLFSKTRLSANFFQEYQQKILRKLL